MEVGTGKVLVDGVENERKMVTKDYTRRYKIRKTKLLQVLDCEKEKKMVGNQR